MRRVLSILATVVVVGAAVAVIAVLVLGGPKPKQYSIVFDNAFGLVNGASFKVGGVEVGAIKKLDVERKHARARVTVQLSKGKTDGFGGLRSDAKCSIDPQSLIGEYFVDCQPGTKGKMLKSGATIPVEQTESPIPPDLVLDVMRMPERQRFGIILNELGAGLATRGDDLNATIRRAIPALTDTNDVLRILAANRRTLQGLSRDSGTLLKVLGRRRADVGRFVTSTRDAAAASADRRVALAEGIRRFPGFLDQLTPTMRDLGTAARLQTPALADLRAAAPAVIRLLDTLRPFSKALTPATTSLGTASKSGRVAVREAKSLVSLLRLLGGRLGEPANNLAILFNDLDDRSRATQKDPDSPGGAGYTGLEAPLQYIFDQSQAINIFDQRGYSLKIDINTGECSNYTTAADAKSDPGRYKRCNENLGPNQPGITTPDPSPPLTATAASTRKRSAKSPRRNRSSKRSATPTPAPSSQGGGGSSPTPTAAPKPKPASPGVQNLIDKLPHLLDPVKPSPQGLGGGTGAKGSQPAPSASAQDLLDFLLAP